MTSSEPGGGDALLQVSEIESGVVTITINRPTALNALTRPMMVDLAKTFTRLGKDAAVKAIILTGAGRAFCAGVDLTAASEVFKGAVKNLSEDPVAQMESCPIPIIGAINGFAFTAGFEIALACDILVASPEAAFADTHCKFGIFPSWGLSQKLPRLIGANRARELSLTAIPLDGTTAERWGLVSRVVPQNELLPLAREIGGRIARNHGEMVRRYKAVLNKGLDLSLGDGKKLEKDRAHDYYSKMTPEDFAKMQNFIGGRSKGNEKRSKL